MFIPSPRFIPKNSKAIRCYPATVYLNLFKFISIWVFTSVVNLFGGKKKRCNLCGWSGSGFYPLLVNNKLRFRKICPRCFSQPKDRNIVYLIENKLSLKGGEKILDIGPSICVKDHFKEKFAGNYFPVDLYPGDPDIKKMDITKLEFAGGTFDYVLCLDVLEHVTDDKKSLEEMVRVLKAGGKAIITTPVGRMGITEEYGSADERQSGHVREYGRDFVDRVRKYLGGSAEISEDKYGQGVSDSDREKYGLEDNAFFLLNKKS